MRREVLDELKAGEASDELFQLLVATVKDYAIFALDPRGHVVTWNNGAERINGYRADEIIGQHFSVFYPPEGAQERCARELEAATREGTFQEEGWRVRKDGTRLWAHVTITALRDKQGRLVGFAKVTRDLSERRHAQEQAYRFRLLVESVKDYAIFILDPGGYVATWNPGAERIKGYRADEIIGQHFSIFYPPPNALERCRRELEEAVREGRFEEEGWRVRKDGSRVWANVTITAIRDLEGTLLGFAKVTRDLTERMQAEAQQRELVTQNAVLAEKARTQEFQERFLAILGHDLRNPLASIDMGLGLLRQRSGDATTQRIVTRMHRSSQRMSRMIEQILDLTRSRLQGAIEIKPAPMELRDTVLAIVEELRSAHPAQAVEVSSPPVHGVWDRDRLEQVFSNLISNAIVHGDAADPVVIRVTHERDRVVIEVHNHGPPIPPELQASLFNPFRRGDRDSRTTKTAGLGLGLYISREIVVAHGGQLDFESDAERGTTFRVSLPVTMDVVA